MKLFKQYIALFLLAGFIFPQAVNSVHYLVVPHYGKDHKITSQFAAPGFDYHSCDYHLSGITPILPGNYQDALQVNNFAAHVLPIFYSFSHSLELAFNYPLRGPPVING